MMQDTDELIRLFDGVFLETYDTRLVRGGDEPIYLPADEDVIYHRVIFAHGFFASALHEVSHWCIAGQARRLQEDYGYWYAPDGRNQRQQVDFEQVEVAPQALELLFSEACGKTFQVSVDNLGGLAVDRDAFAAKVADRANRYRRERMPRRARAYNAALGAFYRQEISIEAAVAIGRQALD